MLRDPARRLRCRGLIKPAAVRSEPTTRQAAWVGGNSPGSPIERQTVTGVIKIVCAAAIVWLAASFGPAQAPAAVDGAVQPAGQTGESKLVGEKRSERDLPAEPDELDIRYLRGPDGQAVWVPDKASLDGYLRWLAQRDRPPLPPAVSVTNLSFDGAAEEERVQLMAHVELRVTSDRWERVPLLMAEATLRDAWTH